MRLILHGNTFGRSCRLPHKPHHPLVASGCESAIRASSNGRGTKVHPLCTFIDINGVVTLTGEGRTSGGEKQRSGRFPPACLFPPNPKGARANHPVLAGCHVVAARAEVAIDEAVRRKEALGVPGRLEPLHLPFSSSCRLVRDLGSIVEVATLPASRSPATINVTMPRAARRNSARGSR
jgi:hypothetical protein